MQMKRTLIIEKLETDRERLKLYRAKEKQMLEDSVQSYTVGTRSLRKYDMDLSNIRSAIKELEREIDQLESQLDGSNARKAVGVIPRDW